MKAQALKPEPDSYEYDLGHAEGLMKGEAATKRILFDLTSNVIHELINKVGVREFILATQRVVGTFLIEPLDDSMNPEDLDIVADHMAVSEALEAARTSSAAKRIDERMQS